MPSFHPMSMSSKLTICAGPPPTQLCTAEEVTLPGGEVAWSKMMGLTVTGRIPQYNAQGEFTGEYTEVPVVFLCVGNHAGYKKATLPLNYSPAVDRDDPDNYGSAAGTIIHEMTHVAGRQSLHPFLPVLSCGVSTTEKWLTQRSS